MPKNSLDRLLSAITSSLTFLQRGVCLPRSDGRRNFQTIKILFSLIFCAWLNASVQAPTADSLKATLKTLKGRDRIETLFVLANTIETVAPQEALVYATEGLTLSRQVGDREKEAFFLSSAGFCYSQMGNFSLAIQYAKETLDLSTKIGNKERMAKAHSTLGITYTFMGAYSQALEEHLESLRIREELSQEGSINLSLNHIGILYHRSGQYGKAIDYYQQILQRLERKPDTARRILTLLNLGFSEYKLGRFAVALKLHQEALNLSLEKKIMTYIAYAHLNLGLTYTDLNNYPKALHYLNLSLSEYDKQDQKFARVQLLNALGRLYSLSGSSRLAMKFAKEGAVLAKEIRANDELKASYELISDLYQKQGNTVESFKYYKLYVATKDSIYTAQESDKIADISMKIITLKKDNQIELLNKEKVISVLRLNKERYFSAILVSSLLFLATVVVLLVAYNRKINQNKITLKNSNSELAQLNAELHEKIDLIQALSGLLPICASCKKIRNDEGDWEQLERYISDHSSATFSHGICPHCAEDLYPEAMQRLREKKA